MTNQKELTITLTDGNKKAKYRTNHFDSEQQLAVIDGLFKFFDVDIDFIQMVNTYKKTGKAYAEFYNETEVVEPAPPIEEVKEQYESALNELAATEEKVAYVPTFSNIRTQNGSTTYQCHYICPVCKNRGNKFVGKYERNVNCHKCLKLMPVQPALANGDLEQDMHGNYFIAGDYKRKSF